MDKNFGTLYRLDGDKGTITSLGGPKSITDDAITINLEVDGDGLLHFAPEQEVFVKDLGFIRAADVNQGMNLLWTPHVPLEFGKKHFPSTLYILGIMSHRYDHNFQSLSSTEFDTHDRNEISWRVQESLRELGVPSTGLPYPPFSRIANTDGTVLWVQISPNFKAIYDAAREKGFISEDFQIPEGVFSRESVIFWAMGRLTGGSVAGCEVVERLGVQSGIDCYDLLETDLPFYPENSKYVKVISSYRTATTVLMIRFENRYWVYPPLSADGNTTDGALCRNPLK